MANSFLRSNIFHPPSREELFPRTPQQCICRRGRGALKIPIATASARRAPPARQPPSRFCSHGHSTAVGLVEFGRKYRTRRCLSSCGNARHQFWASGQTTPNRLALRRPILLNTVDIELRQPAQMRGAGADQIDCKCERGLGYDVRCPLFVPILLRGIDPTSKRRHKLAGCFLRTSVTRIHFDD